MSADLRDRIAAAIAGHWPITPNYDGTVICHCGARVAVDHKRLAFREHTADAVLAVVQPELDRDTERWCLREELEQVEEMYVQRGADNARLRTALTSARRRARLLHDVREWLMYRGYATRRTPLAYLPASTQEVYSRFHVAWLTANLARLGKANTALVREAKRQARRAEEAERHVRVLLDPGVEYQWRSILGQSLTVSRQNEELHLEVRRLNAELAEMTRCRDAAIRALHRDDIETDIDIEETITNALHGPGWDWEDERTPDRIARDVAPAVRPALAKATQQLAAIAALADRWDNALAVDKPYARALRSALTAQGS